MVLLLLACLVYPSLEAQTVLVFPGDANNDGQVDAYDVLHIGWVFGAAGPARSGPIEWAPSPVTAWGDSILSTLDASYADTDGSGIVESVDVEYIRTFYDSIHGLATYVQPLSTLIPTGIPFGFSAPTITPLSPSQFRVDVDVLLGTAVALADSVYNLAFHLHYDTANLSSDTGSVTWTRNAAFFPIGLSRNRVAGIVEVGLSGTDRTAVGTGVVNLGTLGLIMEGNLAGGILADPVLNLDVSAPAVFGVSDLEVLDVWAFADSLALLPTGLGATKSDASWRVGPNPASTHLNVHLDNISSQYQLRLIDALGRIRRHWTQSQGSQNISLEGLSPGCYTLQLSNEYGFLSAKRILVHP